MCQSEMFGFGAFYKHFDPSGSLNSCLIWAARLKIFITIHQYLLVFGHVVTVCACVLDDIVENLDKTLLSHRITKYF